MNMQMNKILVTGASGLLGSNIVHTLSEQFKIFAVYNRHRINPKNAVCIKMDLTNNKEVLSSIQEIRPEWIIHCAALTNVDYCELHPEEALLVNAASSENMALAAHSVTARFMYISTDSIYSGERGNYSENDLLGPVNLYAQTKLEGEHNVQRILQEALIIRTNIYGWNMQDKESLAEWIFNRLQRGESINGFQDIYYSPILVNDLIDILVRSMKLGLSGIFNIAGSERCSKYDFCKKLAEVFGFDQELINPASYANADMIAARPLDTSLCVDRIERLLEASLPDVLTGLKQFRKLYDTGYVSALKEMQSDCNNMREAG